MTDITDSIDESISVNSGDGADTPAPTLPQDAGHDESIAQRLERNPDSKEARLDRALDESMDASDPPASTQPVHNQGPAPSSGYDEDTEKALQKDA